MTETNPRLAIVIDDASMKMRFTFAGEPIELTRSQADALAALLPAEEISPGVRAILAR